MTTKGKRRNNMVSNVEYTIDCSMWQDSFIKLIATISGGGIMTDQQPLKMFFTFLKDWILAIIGLFTAIVSFINLVRDNIAPAFTFFLATLLCVFLYLAFARFPSKIPGGRGIYRFGKGRFWGFVGIGLVIGISITTVFIVGFKLVPADRKILPDLNLAPYNLVKYFDFKESADGWKEVIRWDKGWNNSQPFKTIPRLLSKQGEYGVAYDLQVNAGVEWHYSIHCSEPVVLADVIVVHLYLPEKQSIEKENWVHITANDEESGGVLVRSSRSVPSGKWVRMVLDLREVYDLSGKSLNSRQVYLHVVYSIKGKETDVIQVRLADVTWYREVGNESINPDKALYK